MREKERERRERERGRERAYNLYTYAETAERSSDSRGTMKKIPGNLSERAGELVKEMRIMLGHFPLAYWKEQSEYPWKFLGNMLEEDKKIALRPELYTVNRQCIDGE